MNGAAAQDRISKITVFRLSDVGFLVSKNSNMYNRGECYQGFNFNRPKLLSSGGTQGGICQGGRVCEMEMSSRGRVETSARQVISSVSEFTDKTLF